MAYDNSLIDKRVVERNIKKGLVDPELLKTEIEGLPDREANCVNVSLDGDSADDIDDDFDDEEDDDLDDDIDEDEDEDEKEPDTSTEG